MAIELLPFRLAREIVLANATWFGSETIPISESTGRYTAESVKALISMPRFDSSSVDGYAVCEADRLKLAADGTVELAVTGTSAAGDAASHSVSPGQTVRVMTGARVPEGTAAMVMQEDATPLGQGVRLTDRPAFGASVRRAGAEFGTGDPLIPSGTRLTAGAIALLAGSGHAEVAVARFPKVGILITGSELELPGQPLGDGQVYESISFGLTSALRQSGATEITVLRCRDDQFTIEIALGGLLDSCDVVLTCGGASFGAFDFVRRASGVLKVRNEVAGVAIKPGKPFHFGTRDGVALFGLPGNPFSALATYALFVAPFLARCMGAEPQPETCVELEQEVAKVKGRAEFVPCRITGGVAVPLDKRASHMLLGLAEATHLVEIPAESIGAAAGTRLTAFPLPWGQLI